MLLPKFLSRKISQEKWIDFLSQKSVVRPASDVVHRLAVHALGILKYTPLKSDGTRVDSSHFFPVLFAFPGTKRICGNVSLLR